MFFLGLGVRISGPSLHHGRGERELQIPYPQTNKARQPLALSPLQSSVPAQGQLSPSTTPMIKVAVWGLANSGRYRINNKRGLGWIGSGRTSRTCTTLGNAYTPHRASA